MPPRLSPTAVSTFKECPQLFLFRNMWKLPEPPSAVLHKGILVHSALEKVFEKRAQDRAAALHDVLRDEWRRARVKPGASGTPLVDALFGTVDEERQWGNECLRLLDNWLQEEDPAAMPLGEPVANEAWLSANIPTAGHSLDGKALPPLKMVGKVDRLDALADGVVIVDYKTGKAPKQYSPQMNAEIKHKNFFQLRCYALLIARGGLPTAVASKANAKARMLATRLRLLYLAESCDGGGATAIEEDLPPVSGK